MEGGGIEHPAAIRTSLMRKTGLEAISVACAVNIMSPVGTTTAKRPSPRSRDGGPARSRHGAGESEKPQIEEEGRPHPPRSPGCGTISTAG